MQEIITQIGMDDKHAKIYLACLELGEATIIDIARKTGIKRTTVYENIEQMMRDGFILANSETKRRHFLALDPKELLQILKQREKMLSQIMPQLLAMTSVTSVKPKITTYQGKEGMLVAYEDSLSYPNSEVVGWASGEVLTLFSMKECESYIKKRVQKKIMQTLIMPSDKKATEFTANDNHQLRKTKLVSLEEYPFKIELNIYANKLAIFSTKDKLAVILESEPIASAMRMIFRMCWRGLD
jgi:sugar-specific transcriptional regulator TrmB